MTIAGDQGDEWVGEALYGPGGAGGSFPGRRRAITPLVTFSTTTIGD
jgi:hypothetical protein